MLLTKHAGPASAKVRGCGNSATYQAQGHTQAPQVSLSTVVGGNPPNVEDYEEWLEFSTCEYLLLCCVSGTQGAATGLQRFMAACSSQFPRWLA